MNKTLLGFVCGIVFLACIASIRQTPDGIFITGGFGGEPKFSASQNDQTAPWLDFRSNGVSVFQVPATGILPASFGGTGISNGTNIPVWIVLTGTNGVTFTNQVVNGVIR